MMIQARAPCQLVRSGKHQPLTFHFHNTSRAACPRQTVAHGLDSHTSNVHNTIQTVNDSSTENCVGFGMPVGLKTSAAFASALFVASCFSAVTADHALAAITAMPIMELSELDAGAAKNLETILRPTFTIFTILYIVRITMTWYPNIDAKKLPWAIAYVPTEPVLAATRRVIPLVGGVDITPIIWVGLISFFSEVLLGPQGILTLIQQQIGK